MELTLAELNQLVIQFQQAYRDQSDPLASESFQQIEFATAKIRIRLVSSYKKALGYEASDIVADSLLESCLRFALTENANFHGFYRRVASNKLNDAYQKRKKIQVSNDSTEASFQASLHSEALEAYRTRKRKILDGISFSSDSYLATLLLLQRHRLAAILQKNPTFAFPGNRSDFIAENEIWRDRDQQLRLKSASDCRTKNVWDSYAPIIDQDSVPVQYQIMVAAIQLAGLEITISNWRKMASRALNFIQDQLDEEERRLFDV